MTGKPLTMKKVLVLTYSEDPHADSVCSFFDKANVEYFRVSTEELLNGYSLTFDSRSGLYRISHQDKEVVIDSSWNVWNRRVMNPDTLKGMPKDLSSIAIDETEKTWEGLLFSHKGRVVNRPHNQYYANNKIDQINFALQFGEGIAVPDTIVTNNPDNVKGFYERHDGKICFKLHKGAVVNSSKGYLVVYTSLVTAEHMARVSLVSQNPSLFQEYIEKDFEVRIVATEQDATGIAIYSQQSAISKIDSRKYDLKNVPHKKIELPANVKKFCSEILANYGLHFGVIDFIYSREGKYVFLELNPNGQWLWLEHESGYNLTKEVAENLLI